MDPKPKLHVLSSAILEQKIASAGTSTLTSKSKGRDKMARPTTLQVSHDDKKIVAQLIDKYSFSLLGNGIFKKKKYRYR